MKQIVINARFLTQPITGVQRYAIEISKQLKKIDPTINFVAPSNIININIANELEVIITGKLKGHLWDQIELPKYLAQNKYPLLLNLANTAPLWYKNKVSTILDLSFIHNPKWFSKLFSITYGFMVPKIVYSSLHIFSDSKYVKDDISTHFNISSDKITYGYGDAANIFKNTMQNNEKHKNAYILAVGSLDPRKNLLGLIKAYNTLKTDVKLYIVGSKNKIFKNDSYDKYINENHKIIFTGYINDNELCELYKHAKVFVYPSYYEGFGIPPLEAQACGCPVIVSNVTSLPEVYEDSAIYCNPYDSDDIAGKIRMVLSDIKLQKYLKTKGLNNVKRFSWEKTAIQFYEVLQVL